MVTQPDYFANHSLKLRFPWSLYHLPIVEALGRVVTLSSRFGPEILNVGSGPFFELERLPKANQRFTICDIDPRAIELARQIHGDALARSDVIEPNAPLPYADEQFDLVVSMDVIEHVPDAVSWSREVLRVLKPQGLLFLTTPNYESKSLIAIENTVLELVARKQGFSRKHIHPNKMTAARLRETLERAGARSVHIESVSLGWVLCAYAHKS